MLRRIASDVFYESKTSDGNSLFVNHQRCGMTAEDNFNIIIIIENLFSLPRSILGSLFLFLFIA
jgi:hypothetical protein